MTVDITQFGRRVAAVSCLLLAWGCERSAPTTPASTSPVGASLSGAPRLGGPSSDTEPRNSGNAITFKGQEQEKPALLGPLRLTLDGISAFDADQVPLTIPANVLAWNGKRVSITGCMLPVDFDRGFIHDFHLLPYLPCCSFGAPIKRNQMVKVHVVEREGCKDPGNSHGRAVRVEGTLTVNQFASREDFIYTLSADSVAGVP